MGNRCEGVNRVSARPQNSDAPVRTGACQKSPIRAGSRPARTSEDLPLPEVPTTARRRERPSRRRSSSVCVSLPKKRSLCSISNGRRPGYGLVTAATGAIMPRHLWLDPCSPGTAPAGSWRIGPSFEPRQTRHSRGLLAASRLGSDVDSLGDKRVLPAQSPRAAQIADLFPQPCLATRTVIDQHSVAILERGLVVLSDFRLVPIAQRYIDEPDVPPGIPG